MSGRPGRLEGKAVIITGGTKGIGKGIALMAAQEGANLVIGGRNEAEGPQLAAEISERFGVEAWFLAGDLSLVDNCEKLVQLCYNKFGKVDGLVNNAGIFPRATLLETDESLYDQVFDLNAKAAFFCSKFAVLAMMEKGGSIVHIGSTHGYKGGERLAAYACSKGALHTLSKHIAVNYAQHRIRSNWITVGWVASEGEMELNRREGISLSALEEQAEASMPGGRLQSCEDIAYGVIYLLADESSQTSGTDLHITGAFNI